MNIKTCLPTYAEQEELYNNCYWVWTSSYNGTGVSGYIVYKALSDSDKGIKGSAKYGYTLSANHIFLPAAGYRFNSSFHDVGSISGYGYYLSSSNNEEHPDCAWKLQFAFNHIDFDGRKFRSLGCVVRAVCR